MLCGYFPYLTYAIPAIAGMLIMVPLIECGMSWAFGCYLSTALITLLIGENETKVLFMVFFGYYPILKLLIEKMKNQLFEWVLKLIAFNVAVLVCYYIMSFVYSISFDDLGELGRYGEIIFLALCNLVFVVYDIGFSRIASAYMVTLHDRVKRMLK